MYADLDPHQASCLWWLESGMSWFVEMKSQGVRAFLVRGGEYQQQSL
jgi:hypothetical protein